MSLFNGTEKQCVLNAAGSRPNLTSTLIQRVNHQAWWGKRSRADCKTGKSRTKTSMELLPEDGQDLFKTKVRLQTGGGSMDLRCKHRSASAQCFAAESGSCLLREQAILYKERSNSRLTLKDSLIMKNPRTATTHHHHPTHTPPSSR